MGAVYCNKHACLSVNLCAKIYPKLHIACLPNFACLLLAAVARSSSGGVAIRYVLPVLWITSYVHAKIRNRRREKQHILNVNQQRSTAFYPSGLGAESYTTDCFEKYV